MLSLNKLTHLDKLPRLLYCCFVVVFLSGFSQVNNQSAILPIYTEHFPPYNYYENDTLTGINIELVEALCIDAQIDCRFTLLPWKRAMREMHKEAPSGIMSTARTPKREQQFHWVGPLSSSMNCVYRLANRNDIVVKQHTDLANYTVAISNDSVFLFEFYDIGLTSEKNLFIYLGKFMSLKPFAYGRVDLILGSRNTINEQLAHMNLSANDIAPVLVLNDFFHVGNYLALHKDTPASMVASLQKSAKTLLTNEYKSQIESKFLHDEKAPNTNHVNQELWDRCVKAP